MRNSERKREDKKICRVGKGEGELERKRVGGSEGEREGGREREGKRERERDREGERERERERNYGLGGVRYQISVVFSQASPPTRSENVWPLPRWQS